MTVQKKGVAAASPIHPSRVVDSENAEIILTPREEGEREGSRPTEEGGPRLDGHERVGAAVVVGERRGGEGAKCTIYMKIGDPRTLVPSEKERGDG